VKVMLTANTEKRSSTALLHHPWMLTGLLLACLALFFIADVLGGTAVRLGGMMIAMPALAAVFTGPKKVLLLVAATLPLYVGSLAVNGRLTWVDAPPSLATAAVITTASVGASAVRERRIRQLAQARWVTERTQQALLRPLPRQLGPVTLASEYLASDEESTIGGDLYAGALVNGRPRVIVGDVQGKGMDSIEILTFVLNAFRQAASYGVPLKRLAPFLERALRRDLNRVAEQYGTAPAQGPEGGQPSPESFVTAVIAEVTEDAEKIRIANCGHPPPLLLHNGDLQQLAPSTNTPPLGLLELTPCPAPIDTFDFPAGATMLLYTDGLIESRNYAGEFYPVIERIKNFTPCNPNDLLTTIRNDLRRHANGRLVDDVAMVSCHRPNAERLMP
jgi:serine phosphatase RsbU (regulator of sigma subunit)